MPRPQDGLLSKVIRQHKRMSVHTFFVQLKGTKTHENWTFTLFHKKIAISPKIRARFEKFKIWHTQKNKLVQTRSNICVYGRIFICLGWEDGLYLEHWSNPSFWFYIMLIDQ